MSVLDEKREKLAKEISHLETSTEAAAKLLVPVVAVLSAAEARAVLRLRGQSLDILEEILGIP